MCINAANIWYKSQSHLLLSLYLQQHITKGQHFQQNKKKIKKRRCMHSLGSSFNFSTSFLAYAVCKFYFSSSSTAHKSDILTNNELLSLSFHRRRLDFKWKEKKMLFLAHLHLAWVLSPINKDILACWCLQAVRCFCFLINGNKTFFSLNRKTSSLMIDTFSRSIDK